MSLCFGLMLDADSKLTAHQDKRGGRMLVGGVLKIMIRVLMTYSEKLNIFHTKQYCEIILFTPTHFFLTC